MQRKNVLHIKLDLEEKESLQKRAYTSFGKLILAKESTAPKYSFTGADRNSGDMALVSKQTPGPKYISQTEKIKYSKVIHIKVAT